MEMITIKKEFHSCDDFFSKEEFNNNIEITIESNNIYLNINKTDTIKNTSVGILLNKETAIEFAREINKQIKQI